MAGGAGRGEHAQNPQAEDADHDDEGHRAQHDGDANASGIAFGVAVGPAVAASARRRIGIGSS